MSEKSTALEIFKKFKTLVEKESGETIKCLRTDRGGSIIRLNSHLFVKNMALRGN